MLKSYEAIYDNGQLKWLSDQPQVTSARIIVTILEEADKEESTISVQRQFLEASRVTIFEKEDEEESPAPLKRRSPAASIAGKAKILGDIVSPIVDEEDWECLK
ncbi:MAG: hypothetical protein ACHWZW_10215 [Spirulina sp.]